MNYMSVDAYRIGEFTYWLHFVWTTVLQILIALVILTYSVGWATLSGLVVIILAMVVNTPMAKSQQKYLTQLMAAQDKRLQATAEALRSMKILKLQVCTYKDLEFWVSTKDWVCCDVLTIAHNMPNDSQSQS